MSLTIQMLELLALLLFLAGCVLLHVRLRRSSSLSLLLSIVTLAAWIFWGADAFLRAAPDTLGTGTAKDLRDLGYWLSIATIVSAFLAVWISASFFFAIWAVRPSSQPAA
jgi:hypothetical protein